MSKNKKKENIVVSADSEKKEVLSLEEQEKTVADLEGVSMVEQKSLEEMEGYSLESSGELLLEKDDFLWEEQPFKQGKKGTKKPATYSVAECWKQAGKFGSSREVVRSALQLAGKKENDMLTFSQAKGIVSAFLKKEVK